MPFDAADIRDAYEYDTNGWQPIRAEAKIDMQYVAGNPWNDDDEDQRKDRPMVAPEEMAQYRNQVINSLMANPRGMKFSPIGNGATDKTARFYQAKAREIEYRSHAKQAYITAADCALQRSYGFLRVDTDYASPRSANQEIWIRPFVNPDMVTPDWDALRPDASDMKRCTIGLWMRQADFKHDYPKAKIKSFEGYQSSAKGWIAGNQILVAEHWTIQTRPRTLLLVQPPLPQAPPRAVVPAQVQAPAPLQLFADELDAARARMPGLTVARELRSVDYPDVMMYLTNGVEILHEQKWLGKYIPIVACYGKVLYIEGETGMDRVILSMTRMGRDPWKAYCYACSQELEILGQVPKASVVADPRQLRGFERQWEESPYVPHAVLFAHLTLPDVQGVIPPPQRIAYTQSDNLAAIEVVKEGFRRAIQSAMGSNFLPTQAQHRNEKSGVALDKIDKVAAQGTYHFVNAYEDLIRQTGVIVEDLIDKIYDYQGETATLEADGKAVAVRINDPGHPDAISTQGDHVVTVSTAPSSDSEREAAETFTDALVSNIQVIAGIAGPKVAAAVFARAIRMRNLGPQGDQLADLIEPMEYKAKDGEPPKPELVAAQGEIQHLTQLLQQAAQEQHSKVVEQQGKFAIEKMKVDATGADKQADREVKLAIAELGAKVERMALFFEERARLGLREDTRRDLAHDTIERAKDRTHERLASAQDHAEALDAGAQGHDQALAQADQGAQIASQAAADQGGDGASA